MNPHVIKSHRSEYTHPSACQLVNMSKAYGLCQGQIPLVIWYDRQDAGAHRISELFLIIACESQLTQNKKVFFRKTHKVETILSWD